MKNWLKLHGFKLSVVILFAILAGSFYSWFKQISPALPVVKTAPDFALQDISGKTFQFGDTNGKVRLVEFLFTSCPDICPITMYKMVQLQNELKKQNLWGGKVHFMSVTFDPEHDTPAVFKQYGDRMGIDYGGWNLLTGTEKETADVSKSFGVMVQKMQDGTFVHNVTSLFLVDQAGIIRKVFPMGEDMNNEEIIKMIRSLAESK